MTVTGVTDDPYYELVATTELDRLAAAMRLVEQYNELNHRYQRLIAESRRQLDSERVRLTQARGMAKKLMVLTKASGDDLRDKLDPTQRDTLDAGLAQADELVYGPAPGTG